MMILSLLGVFVVVIASATNPQHSHVFNGEGSDTSCLTGLLEEVNKLMYGKSLVHPSPLPFLLPLPLVPLLIITIIVIILWRWGWSPKALLMLSEGPASEAASPDHYY
jgi:hypothetical protein